MSSEVETCAVTVDEARQQFSDLLRRVAAGEDVEILDEAGAPLALLSRHPDRPPSPEEVEAARARVAVAIREMMTHWAAQGHPVPESSPLHSLLAEGRGDAA